MTHRLRLVALLLGTLLAATACTQLPRSGPVTDGSDRGPRVEERGVYFDPPPPRPGDGPEEIVRSFLVAMTASPMQTSIAREYLTQGAAERWNPQQTYVYEGVSAEADATGVDVRLHDGHRIDARGTWLGRLSEGDSRLRFPVEQEDGEWRIAWTPNALIIPDYQFEQGFRAAQVMWFDPTGRILVPEPVYVAGGDTLSTSLVRNLLRGPAPSLDEVVRTYLPEGLTATSVPIGPRGVADVQLAGTMPRLDAEQQDRLVAQLAWTLRQVPGVRAFTVTTDGEPLTLPGGVTEFPIEQGSEYDPVGLIASPALYALDSEGGLLSGDAGELTRDSGPAAEAAAGWRSLSVDPSGARAAGVTADGRSVQVAAIGGQGRTRTIASGGTDLLEPAWDALGQLWMIDRSQGGALVLVRDRTAPREVRSRGVTGQDVRNFLVSRDGSRLVAVVGGDRLVTARVRRDGRGRVTGLTRAVPVDLSSLGPLRIRDLAWRSPTSVSLLFGSSADVSQVRTVSLDGAPDVPQTSVTTLRGEHQWLVGSPDPSIPAYAVSEDGAVPLDDTGPAPRLGDAVPSTVTYVG